MKKSAIFSALFLFFALAPFAYASVKSNVNVDQNGGDSSVNVKISNNVNTSGSTTVEKTSETKIRINQTGNGTSEVKINGETWKQEGPGTISVNESLTSSPTPTPTATFSASPLPSAEEIESIFSNLFEKVFKLFAKLF